MDLSRLTEVQALRLEIDKEYPLRFVVNNEKEFFFAYPTQQEKEKWENVLKGFYKLYVSVSFLYHYQPLALLSRQGSN